MIVVVMRDRRYRNIRWDAENCYVEERNVHIQALSANTYRFLVHIIGDDYSLSKI